MSLAEYSSSKASAKGQKRPLQPQLELSHNEFFALHKLPFLEVGNFLLSFSPLYEFFVEFIQRKTANVRHSSGELEAAAEPSSRLARNPREAFDHANELSK